jgi:hypothetical protein
MGGKIAPKPPLLNFLPSFASHILTYPSLVALREFLAPLFVANTQVASILELLNFHALSSKNSDFIE